MLKKILQFQLYSRSYINASHKLHESSQRSVPVILYCTLSTSRKRLAACICGGENFKLLAFSYFLHAVLINSFSWIYICIILRNAMANKFSFRVRRAVDDLHLKKKEKTTLCYPIKIQIIFEQKNASNAYIIKKSYLCNRKKKRLVFIVYIKTLSHRLFVLIEKLQSTLECVFTLRFQVLK